MGILYNALVKTSVKALSISRLPAYCLFTIMVALFLGFVWVVGVLAMIVEVFDIKHSLSRIGWIFCA